MDEDTWRFLGEPVGREGQDLIRSLVDDFAGLSREELAATVCEWLGWTRPTGRLKARECREWLQQLETAGLIRLPPKRVGRPVGSSTHVPVTARGEAQPAITGTVRDMGHITVERVTTGEQRRLFRELVGRYHYLSHAVPFGAHVRYLVYASHPARQVVGCVQFSSPAWRMAARDRWIGWDDRTRTRRLPQVVNNSRLLILPWIRAKNLASTILARAARALVADWPRAYGVTPLLLETLVDPARFNGASYRAANWIMVGTTSGRGRQDRDRHAVRRPKHVLLYPLVRGAAEHLRGQ